MWTRIKSSSVGLGSSGIKSGLVRRWLWSRSDTAHKFAAVWGNGDHGRLGLRGLCSHWRPVPLPRSAFSGHALQAIACGGAHTLFLTETGRVYATGLNDLGQLGLDCDTQPFVTAPTELFGLPKEIVHISAGYYHSSAITVDGELYVWGSNINGQLGLGKRAPKTVSLPTKVESLTGMVIAMSALGSDHSVVVTDKGEALSWGGGDSGRLGHGHDASRFGFFKSTSEYSPRLIKTLEGVKIKTVATGLLHSACIDENGSVFIFGETPVYKQASGKQTQTTPSMITELPFSEEVACGGYHTCVLTNGGELYSWGSNENGCLGLGTTAVFHHPERVEGPFSAANVSQVSCGWKHTAAISQGTVFTWGWGGSHGTFSEDGFSSGGQLGHGSDFDCITPTMINLGKNLRALQVSCGFNHTGAILEHV